MDESGLNDEIIVKLKQLRIEHRALDDEINLLLEDSPYVNQLSIQRLKKRKLWLKDAIVKLQSKRIPDLDA